MVCCSIPYLFPFAFKYSKAITADSFMTSPKLPVKVSLPFPFVFDVSINRISPPVLVHAKPVTTPGVK